MKVKTILLIVILLAGIAALAIMNNINQKNVIPLDGRSEEQQESEATRTPSPQQPQTSYKVDTVAVVDSSRGTFKFALFAADMPITCKNFEGLVNKGFYTNLKFHRVEDWVVQGGDPKGNGTGGSTCIQLEAKPGLGFEKPYMVGMARRDDPNSGSCQFFVTKRPASHLSGQYAAFGIVYEGRDVINKIQKNDRMKSIKLAKPSADDLKKIETLIKS